MRAHKIAQEGLASCLPASGVVSFVSFMLGKTPIGRLLDRYSDKNATPQYTQRPENRGNKKLGLTHFLDACLNPTMTSKASVGSHKTDPDHGPTLESFHTRPLCSTAQQAIHKALEVVGLARKAKRSTKPRRPKSRNHQPDRTSKCSQMCIEEEKETAQTSSTPLNSQGQDRKASKYNTAKSEDPYSRASQPLYSGISKDPL